MPPGPTALAYWKQHDKLKLYRPPIVHSEFRATAMPAPPPRRGMVASLFGGNTTVIPAPVGTIVLKNHPNMDAPSAYASRCYVASDVGTQPAIDEPFSFPLEADGGLSAQKLWLANTKVYIESNTAVQSLVINLWKKKNRGDSCTALRTPAPADRIFLASFMAYVDADLATGMMKLVIPIATLIEAASLESLSWQSSPYKLELCAYGAAQPTALVPLAWTYFHVPSVNSVNMIERLGAQKIIRQVESMKLISDGGLATVEDATPDKVAALHETPAERALFDSFQLPQLEAAVTKLQPAGGAPYDAAVLRRDNYLAQYTAEGIPFADVKSFMDGAKAPVTTGEGEAARTYPGYSGFNWQQNSTSYILYRRAKTASFMVTSWGTVALVRKGTRGVFYLESLYVADARYVFVRRADDTLAMVPPTSYAEQKTIETPQRLPRARTHSTSWKRYDFAADAYPLCGIVTQGVSSCNAGITFPDVADPDVIILSHVDGSPSVPIDDAIKLIRARDVTAGRPATAAFRSIFSAHPEVAEIDKYQPASLVDAALDLDYEAVMLPRDGNLWQGICNSREGHQDSYGLLLPAADSGAKATLVGTYGRPDDQLKVVDENMNLDDQGAVAKRFIDYHKGFFGSAKAYRDQVGALAAFDDPSHFANIARFKTRLAEGKKPAETQRAARAKLAETKVFSFPAVGKTLYDRLAGASATIADTNCYLLFEKAQLDIENVDSIETTRGVQRRLKVEAAYDGPIDGNPSDAMTAALRRFQKKKNLPETGLADATTVDTLYSATGY